jgi:L-ascorbate metabolism protein UlaG (beta-lactamase superfamily)
MTKQFLKMKKKKMVFVIIVISLVSAFVAVNLFFILAPQFGGKPDKKRMAGLSDTSLFDGKKFKNLTNIPLILPDSFGKIIKLQFRKNPGRVPVQPLPSVKPVFDAVANTDSLTIIWLGHSSVLIRIHNTIILTDPVFSKRASPVSFAGPKSFPLATPCTPEDIPTPDIILISHDHFDHLDYKTIKKYYRHVKSFFVPLGVRDHLERWGVPPENIAEFGWWESRVFDSSLQFVATPAQHFSGRRKQDNATLWCSWVIKDKGYSVYYCGDSGYGPHFKEIGEKYGPFDITLMECGAYGQYWPNIHMLPKQTVQAQIDLKGKVLIPVHWGKFSLAFHPWKEPIEQLARCAAEQNITLATPLIGQPVTPGNHTNSSEWWKNFK